MGFRRGYKPISPTGTKRLVRRAIKYALANKKKSVTLVAQRQYPEIYRGRVRVIGATNWRAKNFALRQSQSAKSWIVDQSGQESRAHRRAERGHDRAGLEQATDAFKKTVYAEVKQNS